MNCFNFFVTVLIVLFVSVQGSFASMRGCCSYHGGVCGDKCCDGTALSGKCAGGSSWRDFVEDLELASIKKNIIKSKWLSEYPKVLLNIFQAEDDEPAGSTVMAEPLVVKYNGCQTRYVFDGDTVAVTCDGQDRKVRLWGIDSPEKDQRFGQVATHFTVSMVGGKNIDLEVTGTDRYNRVLAIVRVDGVNVNESLVRNGYAWVYRKYCTEPICEDWLQLEKNARAQKKGLWEDVYPVAPWQWRHYGKMAQGVSVSY